MSRQTVEFQLTDVARVTRLGGPRDPRRQRSSSRRDLLRLPTGGTSSRCSTARSSSSSITSTVTVTIWWRTRGAVLSCRALGRTATTAPADHDPQLLEGARSARRGAPARRRAQTGDTVDWAGLPRGRHATDLGRRASRARPRCRFTRFRVRRATPLTDVFGMRISSARIRRSCFSPGGAGKSLFGLAIARRAREERNPTRAILDWEMDGGEQRLRADACGLPPTIRYRRCDQPLVVLADSIPRDVLEHGVGFLLLDSVAPACSGRVEDAEVAIEFFKAWRRIGCGGLGHRAHARRGWRATAVRLRLLAQPSEIDLVSQASERRWERLAPSRWVSITVKRTLVH